MKKEMVSNKRKVIFGGLLVVLCAIVCMAIFMPSKNSTSEMTETLQHATGTIAGHEYIDLGLSVKWATCNVGASSPSDYGDYYAWGETLIQSIYTEDNSKTYGKDFGDIAGNSQYDVARANWGGSWRMPTEAEIQELVDKCTWTWTTQDGHNGYKVTSKANSNSIFLPAAGGRDGSSLTGESTSGCYWSSSPDESGIQHPDPKHACGLGFYGGDHGVNWFERYYGLSVRPVSE